MAQTWQLHNFVMSMKQHLSSDVFQYNFVETFPGDHSDNTSTRQTPGVLYSKALPTPVNKPALIAWSTNLATQLGIEHPNDADVQMLGGNLITPHMQPYAACYAGHQFGNWAGQLGDGRAIYLGQWATAGGSNWDIQLKGAGRTPYSRKGDGRAVLRSSLREYLMSEAMYYLGVPSTRALALVTTGDQVVRDMFYDGRPAYEPGAIVCRTAPSFLRFGNFEMLAARNEVENLKSLIDWTIEQYYPHITGEDRVLTWFGEVVERTAAMIVEWLRVGFVHGVMNTDNMSVLGLTIDYGPFSFLDNYDPDFTPNTTDLPGRRYAFGKQANIAYWNLSCLANALVPVVPDVDSLSAVLKSYEDHYWSKYYQMMAAKLGFDDFGLDNDTEFLQEFEKMMATIQPDMTIFYQLLIDLPLTNDGEQKLEDYFKSALYEDLPAENLELLNTTIAKYRARRGLNQRPNEDVKKDMRSVNPRFIVRNYLLHQAIEELEKGENTLFSKLMQAIQDPYSNKFDEFFEARPAWATQQAGCSMLSCSS